MSPTALSAFGFPLDVMPDELISNSIRRKGMYDVVTAEAIYRLLDRRAQAIDAGAHVGLMSVIMALRVGGGVESKALSRTRLFMRYCARMQPASMRRWETT